MKKIIFFTLLIISGSSSVLLAQKKAEYKKHFIEGNLLLLEENYMRALSEYKQAYQIDSSNANINYKIGFCYLKHASEKHLAEAYLERAVKDVTKSYDEEDPEMKSAPPQTYLYLGQAFHLGYKFDDAVKMYDTYESYINPKRFKEEIALVDHYKEQTKFAIESTSAPVNVQITNLGDSVNSEFPDFSPILSADERMLIFTHAGKSSTGAESGFKTPDDGYFEDIFVSYKRDDGSWTDAKILHVNVNGPGHEGAVGITPDGQTLLVYRDDNGDGNIYYSTWDGTEWSGLVKYGPEINSQYWEPSACLTPDGNVMYFVSNRPGGYGGRDIYRCKKLPNGKWSQAQNLGPKINTRWDEESPFVHPNGEDFFFSSQGHRSIGGFDIMFCVMDSAGGFGEVVPMPYPINTTDDDEFYFASADNKRAYYASAHEDRSGFGEQDIYMITLSQAMEDKDMVVLFKGEIVPQIGDTLPSGITIVVTNKITGEQVGIFKPQRNGNFTAILKPKNTYIFSYQLNGNEFFMEELSVPDEVTFQEIDREVPLKKVVVGATSGGPDKIYLNVNVMNNPKEKKPVPGAEITLVDKDGNSKTIIADGNGKISDYSLIKDNSYKISATYSGNSSEIQKFSTSGPTVNYTKTLYVTLPAVATTTTSTVSLNNNNNAPVEGSFVHHFEYNKTEIEQNPNYNQFLSDLESAVSKNGSVKVSLHSSASTVPTKFAGGNKGLARSRAANLKKLILDYAATKGIDAKKITFQITARVSGPAYNSDYLTNRRKYERFQYVEAKLK